MRINKKYEKNQNFLEYSKFCALLIQLNKQQRRQSLQQSFASKMKPKTRRLTYPEQKSRLQEFIRSFQDDSMPYLGQDYSKYGKKKYMIMMQQIANEKSKIFQVRIEDLEHFLQKDDEKEMVQLIKSDTYRYIDLVSQIIDENLPQRNARLTEEEAYLHKIKNILEVQRRSNMVDIDQYAAETNELIPPKMHRKFTVNIVYGQNSKIKIRSIGQLSSSDIGSLLVLKAIIVRAGEIRPLLSVATYTCDVCGCQNYLEVNDSYFKPLTSCQSKKCRENGVNGKLIFLQSRSRFNSYQQVKIQETPDQLKPGSTPRTLIIRLKENNVHQAVPGEILQIQGVFLPHRRSGFFHEQSLVFEGHIQTLSMKRSKTRYIDMAISNQTNEAIDNVRANTSDDKLFEMMAQSIAPQIYGLEYVKKALLLLLAGGVTVQTDDHMKIRGEINIALIGDPGVAKSQLLKHISYLAPRGIYTTGKGSSGVGLTAAIVADSITRELSLEAGALVLGDLGVCCIDEFDKMEEHDRTAIHEVMEQQTVSIAKAGIVTTLNARTSILAAANPLCGRYDPKMSINKNINLPAALLSRFDLIFLLLDESNKEKDINLARHIGSVHKNLHSPIQAPFSPEFVRAYIGRAKEFTPTFSEHIAKDLAERFIKKRMTGISDIKEGDQYTTMRSLLATIRLCQARARLRFSNQVSMDDILECAQIQLQSKKSVSSQSQVRKTKMDSISAIYGIVKDMCQYSKSGQASLQEVQKRALARGYLQQDISITLKQYENLNTIMITHGMIKYIEQSV